MQSELNTLNFQSSSTVIDTTTSNIIDASDTIEWTLTTSGTNRDLLFISPLINVDCASIDSIIIDSATQSKKVFRGRELILTGGFIFLP